MDFNYWTQVNELVKGTYVVYFNTNESFLVTSKEDRKIIGVNLESGKECVIDKLKIKKFFTDKKSYDEYMKRG